MKMFNSTLKHLLLAGVALYDASVSASVLQPTPPMGMGIPNEVILIVIANWVKASTIGPHLCAGLTNRYSLRQPRQWWRKAYSQQVTIDLI